MSRATRIRVAAGVARRGDEILLTRRPPGGAFPLQWEFPGGKIERGETPERALVREIREELGVDAIPGGVLATHTHEYASGLEVEIVFVASTLTSLEFTASGAEHEVRWARPEDVAPSEILEGDRRFLAELKSGRVR